METGKENEVDQLNKNDTFQYIKEKDKWQYMNGNHSFLSIICREHLEITVKGEHTIEKQAKGQEQKFNIQTIKNTNGQVNKKLTKWLLFKKERKKEPKWSYFC